MNPKFLPNFIQTLLDFFYPPFCFDCGGKVKNREYLCGLCRDLILDEPVPAKESSDNQHINCIISCFYFELPLLRNAVHALKYAGIPGPANELLSYRLPQVEIQQYDYVVPVPLHWRKLMKRGYNQAEVLAEVLVHGGKARSCVSPIRRKRFTKTQTMKNRWERKGAMREVFGLKKRHVDLTGKTILLVDDVCTTGSTAQACAKLLKQAGSTRVDLFTLGRA